MIGSTRRASRPYSGASLETTTSQHQRRIRPSASVRDQERSRHQRQCGRAHTPAASIALREVSSVMSYFAMQRRCAFLSTSLNGNGLLGSCRTGDTEYAAFLGLPSTWSALPRGVAGARTRWSRPSCRFSSTPSKAPRAVYCARSIRILHSAIGAALCGRRANSPPHSEARRLRLVGSMPSSAPPPRRRRQGLTRGEFR